MQQLSVCLRRHKGYIGCHQKVMFLWGKLHCSHNRKVPRKILVGLKHKVILQFLFVVHANQVKPQMQNTPSLLQYHEHHDKSGAIRLLFQLEGNRHLCIQFRGQTLRSLGCAG